MAILIRNRRIVEEPSPPPDLVVLEPDDRLEGVEARLAGVSTVAVRFPKYGDGRGYSIARLLRDRHGFDGELRAVGEVARDHLWAMAQCGFDAFELREGEDPREALTGLDDFRDAYQASAAEPLPLFRRRAAR